MGRGIDGRSGTLDLVQNSAQEQPLDAGFNVERTLGPGENHVYTITL